MAEGNSEGKAKCDTKATTGDGATSPQEHLPYSLSEFMERDELALNVSLRICGKKTKEAPFQLVKKKMGRNDDATMPAAFFSPLTMQSAKVSTIMREENSSTRLPPRYALLLV